MWSRNLLALAGMALSIVLLAALPQSASGTWTDCDQSLYVANEGNGGGGTTVVRVDCIGNVTTYATGFTGTSGLIIDSATGDLIIADDSPGIFQVDTDGNIRQLAEFVELSNPNGLGLDASGRLLVADTGDRILRLTLNPDGSASAVEILARGFPIPQGVVATATGDVLFTDWDGYVYRITPTTSVPIDYPAVAQRLLVGQVAPGNQGSIKLDVAGNIYTANFGGRIVRISPDGLTVKNIIDISPADCPPGQAGGAVPGFRGLEFDPDGNLVATGYCLDNIYIFAEAAIDQAWNTGIPISDLPQPFAENPSGALDGPDFNGPFGIAFWFAQAAPLTGAVPFDIKPTSCPNPLQVKGKGVIPAAILGTDQLDVTQIDPESLLLLGAVKPLGWSMEDVGAPFAPYVGKQDVFDCTEDGPDGYLDLTLKFDKRTVAAVLGEVKDGEILILDIAGHLTADFGYLAIQGEDVMIVRKKN